MKPFFFACLSALPVSVCGLCHCGDCLNLVTSYFSAFVIFPVPFPSSSP
jgi:hypothetical protein